MTGGPSYTAPKSAGHRAGLQPNSDQLVGGVLRGDVAVLFAAEHSDQPGVNGLGGEQRSNQPVLLDDVLRLQRRLVPTA